MPTDLIIGFTGSPAGRDAVALGRRLALATGARPTVVHVRPPRPPGGEVTAVPEGWSWGASVAATLDEARPLLAAVAADEASVRVERCVAEGDLAGEIARHSDDADLLVIGSRGYGPVRRAVLRGAAGRIARAATCPVLVVPRRIPVEADEAVVPLAAAVAGTHVDREETVDG
jgi:nucleotide-binding universal stress UspA family protein